MAFVGRVRNGARVRCLTLWSPSRTGWLGRPAPLPSRNAHHNQGEVERWRTAESVIKEWIKSLKAQGCAYEVEDDGVYTVVRSV